MFFMDDFLLNRCFFIVIIVYLHLNTNNLLMVTKIFKPIKEDVKWKTSTYKKILPLDFSKAIALISEHI